MGKPSLWKGKTAISPVSDRVTLGSSWLCAEQLWCLLGMEHVTLSLEELRHRSSTLWMACARGRSSRRWAGISGEIWSPGEGTTAAPLSQHLAN
jgi:hypothetical protein